MIQTTFYQDFSIADHFGIKAIKDTYKRCVEGWKHSIDYMIALSFALNSKCWSYYQKNATLCELYSDLYYKCRDYCLDHFKGDELTKYIRETD